MTNNNPIKRAILIDPFTETITEVKMVDTKLQTIYALIGCELITITNLANGIDMILDDEGLLKDSESQAYFKFGIGSQPFAGKALIIATDDEGDFASLPEKVSVEKINDKVIFFKPSKQTLAESLEIKILPF
ncbi:MAG: DUF3846 domain-containing protein [Proteobacteria bacterium]|nr:DUF3846 domain-containing protein [Pseudomonadota bacterium]